MIKKYEYQNLVWIDIEEGTKEEIAEVAGTYDIHPLIELELQTESFKPRVELYENFVFAVLHFPALRHSHAKGTDQEVDFVIGKNFIITVRYDSVDSLHKFAKLFETKSIIDKSDQELDSGILFLQMIQKLYGSVMHEIEAIQAKLEEIKEGIFKNEEREMVAVISKTNRGLLDLEKGILFHEETLKSLQKIGGKFFGQSFDSLFEVTLEQELHLKTLIRQNMHYLDELRKTNDSLLQSKQNEAIKFLTAATLFISPFFIVAALFSMETIATPIVGTENDFWIIFGIMIFVSCSMIYFFKHKKFI